MSSVDATDAPEMIASKGVTSQRAHWPASLWASRPRGTTVLGLLAVVAAALLYLAPTLAHGDQLGSQDILGVFGLGSIPGAQPHNPIAGDQIEEMMPWAALSWEAIRHGHLPLWNPYSGFGMPLLFNFVAASLSLPMLVSYLGPEHLVYTIESIVKLLIAGTGTLWMCRRLGLGNLSSALAAVSYMLCGSITGWLGWPMSGTMAWMGWVLGTVILIVQTERRRTLHLAGLAVSLGFVVYAGHPETLAIVVLCAGLTAAVMLLGLWRRTGTARSLLKPLRALVGAGVGGMALGAPLLLPGLQVVSRAARTSVRGYPLPAHTAVNLAFATYSGLPILGSTYFGAVNYYETAAYVGVIVLMLAVMAVILRGRNPVVIALVGVSAACVLLTYSASVSRILDSLPMVQTLQWTRAVIALDFSLCVLGGIGLQAVIDRRREPITRRAFAVMSALAALSLGVLWWHHTAIRLTPLEHHIQSVSFLWPFVEVATLLVATGGLFWSSRNARLHAIQGGGLPWATKASVALVCLAQAGFLLTATPNLWSSSSTFFPVTAAESALQQRVGSARVGFADCPSILSMPNLGILSEANDAYHLREASAYDGTVPLSYFTAYYGLLRKPVPADTGFGQYCPSMSNARLARHFGVGFVLAEAGSSPPAGMVLDSQISGEDLYRVPGGGVITLQPEGAAADGPGATVEQIATSDPSNVRLKVAAASASIMYIHVTDFPGWSAKIDGRALALKKWGGTMLSAAVSPGPHSIVLSYKPSTFEIGELLAGIAAVLLVAAVIWESLRGGWPGMNRSPQA